MRYFLLVAVTVLAACTKSDDIDSWKYRASKDNITDRESFNFQNISLEKNATLVITCSRGDQKSQLFLFTKVWLGKSNVESYNLRAGTKEAISQRWIGLERSAAPLGDSFQQLVDYIGNETRLVLRAKKEAAYFDYTFDVTGFPSVVSKLSAECR